MVFPLAGIIGGMIGLRGLHAASVGVGGHAAVRAFIKSPLIQGGGFGLGYTGGAYGGYGISNTADPLGVHKPKYKRTQQKLGLPYGSYGYGRRNYYGRRRRYRSRYGYRRRSYYRRGYY